MSDFYTVLKQSIVDRGLRKPAEREAVYGQARAAIIRQLWSYDPPLAEDEIDARIGAFDRTVERIEGDVVSIFGEAPRHASRPEAAAPPRRAAPAEDEEDLEATATATPIQRAPAPARKPQEPSRPTRRTDPLAERSAAIEQALRGDYGTLDDESADDDFPAEPAETAHLSEDESDWQSRDEYRADEFQDEEFDEHDSASADDGADERAEDRPSAPAAARPRRAARRTASRQSFWSGLPEKTQVRILIGAIAALGLVVLIAIVAATTSLFSGGSGGEAEAPAQPGGIITAAQPATIVASQPADVVQSFTLFDGSDPTVFDSSSDNPVRFDKDTDGQSFARISSSTASPGVRLNIGPGIASRLAGQPARIVIVARSSKENGALNMRFAYQSGVALSHWQSADLGGDYTSYGIVWRVPAIQTDPNGDYLLIEPGIPGDGTATDIRSVRLDLLAKEPG